MGEPIDVAKLRAAAKLKKRYEKQLERLQGIGTTCIEAAVASAVGNLAAAKKGSLVIYGEPQSGKTEMMICLTAKLLDIGHPVLVHLMNDSVDLLTQNLKRFVASGLAPAPKNASDLINSTNDLRGQEIVVFCKKNARDLEKLIVRLEGLNKIVVIDDEADYATPNAKINKGAKTRIHELVGMLIGQDGYYIGVTATPARLNLNNTFDNEAEYWVHFPTHREYTGQDVFFPLNRKVSYRLTLIPNEGKPQDAQDALLRFLVTSAYLNTHMNRQETNYTFLVHTSGKKDDHEADRAIIEEAVHSLIDTEGKGFPVLIARVHALAMSTYPAADTELITTYIVENASRTTLIVLNSERDRRAAGDSASEPTSPFTIIIGGNIVSRGVTFPNLLSMFFTRNVAAKLQQDTYIQRARMFGARGEYLSHFELTIPDRLYADWHKCFVFHRLALEAIKNNMGSPVWIGDRRVSVVSAASINKATVALDKGEMSFQIFDYSDKLDEIVAKDQTSTQTLRELSRTIGGNALPEFLINYIESVQPNGPRSLAIHTASSIEQYGSSADKEKIARNKGFLGRSQLEVDKFREAVHHIKILHNGKGKARVFYKYVGSVQFIQNLRNARENKLEHLEPLSFA